jgi:hypothetical protein
VRTLQVSGGFILMRGTDGVDITIRELEADGIEYAHHFRDFLSRLAALNLG